MYVCLRRPRDLDPGVSYNRRSPFGALLPAEMGISGRCQHADTVAARGRGAPREQWTTRLADAERGVKPGYMQQQQQGTEQIAYLKCNHTTS